MAQVESAGDERRARRWRWIGSRSNARSVFTNVVEYYWPDVLPADQETGAAWEGGPAVQGLGRSGSFIPAGNVNSATGVLGPPP